MSTSTVKIYKNTKINPRKNFAVDSLATYLATLTPITITGFQYIKHALSIEIKIDESQTYLENLSTYDYDYCSIQNTNGKIMYYFITDKKWASSSCVKLSLVMDTINTFTLGTDYELDDKTLVNRQHFDRYIEPTQDFGGTLVDDELTAIPTNSETEYVISPQGNSISDGVILEGYNHALGYIIRYNDGVYQATQSETSCEQITFDNSTNKVYFYSGGVVIDSFSYSDLTQGSTIVTVKFYDAGESGVITDSPWENFSKRFVKRRFRNIPLSSEGISPILYGQQKEIVQGDNENWYLIYAGSNLRAYLTNDSGFEVVLNGDGNIDYQDLVVGRYYYILPDLNNNRVTIKGSFTDGNNNTTTYNLSAYIWYTENSGLSYGEQVVTVYYRNGTDVIAYQLRYTDIGLGFFYVSKSSEYTLSSLVFSAQDDIDVRYLTTQTNNTATIRNGTAEGIVLTSQTVQVRGLSALNRYDSALYKIIKLPYCPVSSFESFKYDSSLNGLYMIYLDDLDYPFENTITPTYNPLENILFTPDNLNITKTQSYESKLYHSDYYQPKFIYDSFSFIFNLELVNTDSLDTIDYALDFNTLPITYNVTNTINSRFMFTFTSYLTDGKSLGDYDNVLVVTRNNEVSIFTSAYVDYLKSGYNYDVKNKQRQDIVQWSTLGIGTAVSAANYGIGGGGLAGGLTLAGSTVNQVIGAVNSTLSSEQAIQQKLAQLSRQHASVSGSDDVDLMTYYTSNKAKYMLYQASEKMQKVLYDLFFYTGYIDGTMHTPDTTSRTRFNFVSCEPVINNLANISEELIDDLTTRYNAGVTFIHYYESYWDFEQTYENWEVSLYE